MNIREQAEKYNDYIVEQRRYFHRHPELSFEERETTAAIKKELESMGIPAETFPDYYGLIGTIQGAESGPVVMLRADIDALPSCEKTGLPFASENEGCMHACGHDAHIAMLLGAARILSDMKDELRGRVKFFFQPAEELAQGAKAAVELGVMDGVDAAFGTHVWGQVDAGKISIEHGERMASCDIFTLTVHGEASHGSAPHLGCDAIVAASAAIMALQTLISRKNNPLNSSVLTIGTFDGGQRFNIIADKVLMDGTVRTFSPKFRMEIEHLIRQTAQDVCRGYGCTAELEYKYLTGAVINSDAKTVDIARHAAEKLYGAEFLGTMEKLTGSEDFAYLMEKAPSVYTFLGGRDTDTPGSEKSNHHGCYTIDEKILKTGAAVAAQFAVDMLEEIAEK